MQKATHAEIVELMNRLAEGETLPLREARRAMIQWALSNTGGNVSQAASLLGTSRGTIYRYVRM